MSTINEALKELREEVEGDLKRAEKGSIYYYNLCEELESLQ